MKNFGIKEAWVHKVLVSFCDQMTCEELQQEKTKQSYFPKFFLEPNFVFFSTSPSNVQTQQKFARSLQTIASLMPKKSYFFKFSCYFFEFIVHERTYLLFFLCHELLKCPNSMKICTHLVNLSIFDTTKFQIFLLFFQDGQCPLTSFDLL